MNTKIMNEWILLDDEFIFLIKQNKFLPETDLEIEELDDICNPRVM